MAGGREPATPYDRIAGAAAQSPGDGRLRQNLFATRQLGGPAALRYSAYHDIALDESLDREVVMIGSAEPEVGRAKGQARAAEVVLLIGSVAFLSSCIPGGDQTSAEQWETWSVAESPALDVGELEGDADYIFSRISAIELLPEGRVAVADGGALAIRVYGADGLLDAEFGARGQGPGEFESLHTIDFLPPDTILAYDSRAARITKFGTDGTLRATVEVQADRGAPEVYAGQTSSGDHIIAWIRFGRYDPSALTPDLMDVGRFDSDGGLLGVLTTRPGMRRLRGPVPFSPHFVASMIGDSLVMTDGMAGAVQIVELPQGAEFTMRMALAPPSLDEAWQQLEAALPDPERVEQLHEARETAPDSIPVFSDLLTDDQGNVWLKLYEPATDSHLIGRQRNGGAWVVARPDGSIVAEVSMPRDVQLMDVSGAFLVGVARDALGVESVRVYELLRG